MIIEKRVRALIVRPGEIKDCQVTDARYFVFEMVKYSFVANDHSPGGWVRRDEPKELTLNEVLEYRPEIIFYDDFGRYRKIPVVLLESEDLEVGYRVKMRFRFENLRFNLSQFVDDSVPCNAQLNG